MLVARTDAESVCRTRRTMPANCWLQLLTTLRIMSLSAKEDHHSKGEEVNNGCDSCIGVLAMLLVSCQAAWLVPCQRIAKSVSIIGGGTKPDGVLNLSRQVDSKSQSCYGRRPVNLCGRTSVCVVGVINLRDVARLCPPTQTPARDLSLR
jgi:hypothetical protein